MQTSTSKKNKKQKKQNSLMAFFTLSKTKVFELIKKIFIQLKCKQVLPKKKNIY
jgi:hypothetical protein